ncbi:MAG: fatty acid desaturase [Planctomycetota bacterium]
MDERKRQVIRSLHEASTRSFWQNNLYILLFFAVMGVSLVAWEMGYWPITLACWALQAHIGHMNLIAFHEASHYLLHPKLLLNEFNGMLIGSIILTPLSVYRYVHHQHHSYLGTRRDTELWPYVLPGTSRVLRILSAMGELLVGFFYTPIVFVHGYLTADRMPKRLSRRIAAEYALCIAFWCVLSAAVTYLGVWEYFLVGYLVPTMIAGNLQSIRKFTEHMGMLGDDVPSTTRTVVDPRLLGSLLSKSMMHIDFHGIHHRYARIPQYNLPRATTHVYAPSELQEAIFPSYWSAMWDMFKSLGNPRVGRQWLEAPAESKDPATSVKPRSVPRGPTQIERFENAARS